MDRPNTVAGLLAKRDAMRRDLAEAEAVAKAIRINIDHLNATLKLFTEDGPRKLPSKPPILHNAAKGEVRRFVLRMLRETDGPITSQEVTDAWTKARGLSADHDTFVLLRKRMGACLGSLKQAGRVRTVRLDGPCVGYELVPLGEFAEA